MLILYRRDKQRILIGTEDEIENGEAIVITCLKNKDPSRPGFNIGIDAPPHIKILREELLNEADNRR